MTQSLLQLYKKNKQRYLDTDKEEPKHHYISKCYSSLFEPYQNEEINLLEIGVASGGSLLLWYDYFINAKIYGVDTGTDARFKECIENVKPYTKINLIQSDGYNTELVQRLPEFDIIIDDGPHTFSSHISCLELYLPKLKVGGLLILEDIEDISYINFYNQIISKNKSNFNCEVVDTDRSIEYNNLLYVIKKL